MKKIFTLIMTVACSALTAWATDYTGNLAVVVNDSPADPQKTVISVENTAANTYRLVLDNFILETEETTIPVGKIELTNVSGTDENGVIKLSSTQNIIVEAGSDDSQDWLGPILLQDPIPVTLMATIAGDILKANIDIPFGEMSIKVFFSSAVYQIPNSDFELFHKENSTIDEPNHWHSFASCTGSLAGIVKGTAHTFVSEEEVRPNTVGSKSLLVKATKTWGVVANGTVTTGRMNAGSMSASDTKNHAFLDLSNTDKDNNGDPFYTVLNGRPDAVKVWVKFKQATAQDTYPYATVNAVITDGTSYQDPEDKTYSNVVAKATNAKIETNDFAWQELTIPFKYENDVEGKAILVTISTNATPGKGSNGDELYVDDLSLVYNAGLANLSVFGTPVSGFTTDNTTYAITVDKLPTASDIVATPLNTNAQTAVYIKDKTVTVITFGEDLMSSKSYILNLTVNTGIEEVKTADNQQVTGIYNLNGQRVNEQVKGQVYITKYADGSTVKTIGK